MALFSHGLLLRLKDRWRFTPVRQTATVRPLWSQGSKQVLHAILTGDCLNSLKLRVSGAVGQAFHCGVCRRIHHNLGCKRLSARRPTLTRVMDLEPAAARGRGRGGQGLRPSRGKRRWSANPLRVKGSASPKRQESGEWRRLLSAHMRLSVADKG